jgi:hypothetical protein
LPVFPCEKICKKVTGRRGSDLFLQVVYTEQLRAAARSGMTDCQANALPKQPTNRCRWLHGHPMPLLPDAMPKLCSFEFSANYMSCVARFSDAGCSFLRRNGTASIASSYFPSTLSFKLATFRSLRARRGEQVVLLSEGAVDGSGCGCIFQLPFNKEASLPKATLLRPPVKGGLKWRLNVFIITPDWRGQLRHCEQRNDCTLQRSRTSMENPGFQKLPFN